MCYSLAATRMINKNILNKDISVCESLLTQGSLYIGLKMHPIHEGNLIACNNTFTPFKPTYQKGAPDPALYPGSPTYIIGLMGSHSRWYTSHQCYLFLFFPMFGLQFHIQSKKGEPKLHHSRNM